MKTCKKSLAQGLMHSSKGLAVILYHQMYLLPRTAVAKHPKLGNLKQ